MRDNLESIILNIKELIELKKERLRELHEEQKILVPEIIDLEKGLFRLEAGTSHEERKDKGLNTKKKNA